MKHGEELGVRDELDGRTLQQQGDLLTVTRRAMRLPP